MRVKELIQWEVMFCYECGYNTDHMRYSWQKRFDCCECRRRRNKEEWISIHKLNVEYINKLLPETRKRSKI